METKKGNREETPATGGRHTLRKVVKGVLVTIGSLVALCVIGLCILTLWLTPDRLTRIINREASEVLNADVRASNVRFTLWSTWPHLMLESDSIYVRSRTLDSVPPAIRRRLPADADFLMAVGSMKGGVNVMRLFTGKIWVKDVEIDSLRVNLLAVTDSLNNYDILPGTGKGEVPRFHIDGLRITGKGRGRFRSLPTATTASVVLDSAYLMPAGSRDANDYHLHISGDVNVKSGNLTLFHDFPFGLDGDMKVKFKPFGISTTDYRVSLGKVSGRMSVDIDMGKDVKVNNFDYRLNDVSLTDLLSSVPGVDASVFEHLRADVNVECTARLTSPYNFSSAWLPSVMVEFAVPGGSALYTLADGQSYMLDKVRLYGHLMYDGKSPANSYIDIPEIELAGLGTDVRAHARVTSLTTTPEIAAGVEGECRLGPLARRVSALQPYAPAGNVRMDADLRFRIADNTISGTVAKARVRCDSASFGIGDWRVAVKKMDAVTGESYAPALTLALAKAEIPLHLTFTAGEVIAVNGKESLGFRMGGMTGTGDMSRRGDGVVLRNFDVKMHSRQAHVDLPDGLGVDVTGMDSRVQAQRLAKLQKTPRFTPPAQWSADALSMRITDHTPAFITCHASQAFKDIMERWRAQFSLAIASASIDIPGYDARTGLQGIDLAASFDSVSLRHIKLWSGVSEARISGNVRNLRQFIGSPVPAPLRVNLRLDMDTMQINQLARAYAMAHPKSHPDSIKNAPQPESDSIAHIVPRNLYCNITFSAAQTRYMNLKLFDLYGKASSADGLARIDTLHIGADFGEGVLAGDYDTRNLQNMSMRADLGFVNVNVVNFFNNFHSLSEMWPEMRNLSGMLSARLSGRVLMFPTMYLNVPSLWATADVKGWDLVLKQNKFIRHITRMLLIPTSGPLHIHDMDVRAVVHNNLLEVFPFTFEVSDYKLRLLGMNNFNGDLYYHVGVEKWPLHIPFGLNVTHTYHHPVIHFGGRDWHNDNGTKIAAGVQDYDRLNVMKELRHYAGEFVHAAAVYKE